MTSTRRKGVRLSDLDKGMVPADFEQALNEVAAAVVDLRRKGTVTLKVDLVPDDKLDVVYAITKVEGKRPVREGVTQFFIDLDNRLSRRDPNQPELWPEADAETGEIT